MKFRRHGRIPVEYSASFSSASARGKGVIVDISLGGCRARSAFSTQEDDRVGVVICLPADENPLYVMRAIIRWTVAEEFGLEFMDMELSDRQRLNKVIEKSAGPA
jgi:PilZ domain